MKQVVVRFVPKRRRGDCRPANADTSTERRLVIVSDACGFREHGQIILSLAANFRRCVTVISMNQSSAQEEGLYCFMSRRCASTNKRDVQDEFLW